MSQTSLGMGSGIDGVSSGGILDTENLSPEGGTPPESFYDLIAYVIYCGAHEKIALTRALKENELRAVWFPFVSVSSVTKWRNKAKEGIQLILKKEDLEVVTKIEREVRIPMSRPQQLQIYRIQCPVIHKFITRLIYFVEIEKSPDFQCCENTKQIQWFSIKDAISGRINKVWGPEVKQFARLCKKPKTLGIREYTLRNAYQYVADKDTVTQNYEQELLQVMKIKAEEVEVIYHDFLEHCFPAIQMTIHSFKDYLMKYGYNSDEQKFPMLFKAFDYNESGFIEFTQLLIGLILMDPNSPHRQLRVGFIFRFYDIDCDGFLNSSELKTLISDCFPGDDNQTIDQKTKEWFQIMNTKIKCSFSQFVDGIASLKLRGTSTLCRSEKSLLKAITKPNSNRESETPRVVPKFKDGKKDDGPCSFCRVQRYEYALHVVCLDTEGRAVNIHHLRGAEESEVRSVSRIYSKHFTFERNSMSSAIIDLIREFDHKKSRSKGFAVDDETFAAKVLRLCKTLDEIISIEDRVIKINGPVYVVGDIFGNLSDLMSMDRLLWQGFPVGSPNCVFLGNYVDFGKWCVECVVYLFCLKIVAPNKVFLLRGRHEVRDIQIENTFLKECIEKYNQINGKKIWNLINDIFDKLPFAVVIDETIFCANSGIPNTRLKVQNLNKISRIVKNPSVDSSIAYQLINNEVNGESVKSDVSSDKTKKSSNLFNEIAVNAFLEDNGFTHIICGNRQTPNGQVFHFGSKFINIFSTSDNNNSNNKWTIILLQNHKIRVIRSETPKEDMKAFSDNKSISDINKSATN